MNIYYEPAYLQHHGVKGMKWGRRRYQNADGSLTAAGKKRYITISEAKRNATRAAEKARKESVSSDRERLSGIGSFAKANRNALAAKRKAYDESIAADKAHNRQLRAERKQAKKDAKEQKKQYNEQLKRDMKTFKRHGAQVDYTIDSDGNIAFSNYQIAGRQVTEKYIRDVNSKIAKQNVSKLVGTAAVIAGASVVSALLER